MKNLTKLKTELTELETKSMNIKLEISRKMADIINAKNEEPTDSPSIKYLKEAVWINRDSPWHDNDVRDAHEAGQKHGAGVERERYSPLKELCEYMTRHYMIIFAQGQSSQTLKKLTAALKDLEKTEPSHGGELPEKPSWVERLREKKQTAKVTIYDDGSMDIDGDVYVKMPSVTFT